MSVNSITLNQNELQPLRINAIYSDIEDDAQWWISSKVHNTSRRMLDKSVLLLLRRN